jgi:hypothetical protein
MQWLFPLHWKMFSRFASASRLLFLSTSKISTKPLSCNFPTRPENCQNLHHDCINQKLSVLWPKALFSLKSLKAFAPNPEKRSPLRHFQPFRSLCGFVSTESTLNLQRDMMRSGQSIICCRFPSTHSEIARNWLNLMKLCATTKRQRQHVRSLVRCRCAFYNC